MKACVECLGFMGLKHSSPLAGRVTRLEVDNGIYADAECCLCGGSVMNHLGECCDLACQVHGKGGDGGRRREMA
jgi:hypothetical protein